MFSSELRQADADADAHARMNFQIIKLAHNKIYWFNLDVRSAIVSNAADIDRHNRGFAMKLNDVFLIIFSRPKAWNLECLKARKLYIAIADTSFLSEMPGFLILQLALLHCSHVDETKEAYLRHLRRLRFWQSTVSSQH